MDNELIITLKDHAMMKIEADLGIKREISEGFAFFAHNYKHMPMYKNRMWDGKIRLYNELTGELNVGLYPRLVKWCEQRDYNIEVKDSKHGLPCEKGDIKFAYLYEFIKKLNLPWDMNDYQFKAIYLALTDKRRTIISPTGSGKSLIIYTILSYYLAHYNKFGKVLIVVPTIGLVTQMMKDFKHYGLNSDDYCHAIFSGADKNNIKKPIIVSTWQSIYKLQSKWFDKFGCVIGDECHGFKAKCLSSIMNKSKNAPYRIGMTGTLDGAEVNQLVLEGLFGPVIQVIKTKELQDRNFLADLDIKMIRLNHPRHLLPTTRKVKYKEELEAIVCRVERNRYIVNLAKSMKGNTLILFNFIEKQGDVLDAMFKKSDLESYYYVHGGVKGNDREYVRNIVEKKDGAIILASYGVFSTGINIRNLHNIIFASPYKSQVRILQSIGRVLRLSDNGVGSTLYDLFDMFDDHNGYSYLHGLERQRIYKKEGFKFKVYGINLQ